MVLPLEELRAQIFQFCAENKISIVFLPKNGEACSDEEQPTIYIYPIKTMKTYAIALHELGHLLSAQARKHSMTGLGRLAKESYAWRWAKKNAKCWTDTAEKHKNQCLASYRKNLNPPQDHIFWRVYKR
jgi:hypothetical protein